MAHDAEPHGPFGHLANFDEDKYPFWRDHFPTETRRKMVDDDLFASESVSILLMSIVVVGLCLGVTAILITISFW